MADARRGTRFRFATLLAATLGLLAGLLAGIQPAAAAELPTGAVVIDDFNDNDAGDWGFFGGSNAGGAGGAMIDRPYEGTGYLSTGWGGQGTDSGFYGGAFRNFDNTAQPTPPVADPWFNVWVLNQSDATVDGYTLEVTLREDTDGDGWTDGAEDSVRFDTTYTSADFDDQWTLISAPLSAMTNLGTGGNGTFDGALDEIVVVVAGVTGADGSTVEADFDAFAFTSGPITTGGTDTIDDFESGVAPATPCAPAAPPLGFCTFNGAGSAVTLATTTTPPDQVPGLGTPNTVLQMDVDVTSFAGFIRGFSNPALDTWIPQDWSTSEGISLWLHGTGSGTDLFIDILDNRNVGSTTDDAERWTVPFADDFVGWQLLEFPFSSFTRKEIGNGAPNDGLGLFEMHGWALGTLGTGGPRTYYVDEVSLYGVAEPPAVAVQFAVNITSIDEGTTGAVAVRLNRPLGPDDPDQVSISYRTEPSTATAGIDYTPTSGTLTFVNGGTSELTFPLETFDDTKFEGDERVVLRLIDPVDIERGTLFQGSALIIDNDTYDPDLLDDFVQGHYLWESTGAVELSTETLVAGQAGERPDQDTYENVLNASVSGPGDTYGPAIDQAIADLGALLPAQNRRDGKRIEAALRQLMKPVGNTHVAFTRIRNAINQLEKVRRKAPEAEAVEAVIDDLVATAASLADDAIVIGELNGLSGRDLSKARLRIEQGDREAAKGKAARAVDRYRQAWDAVRKALRDHGDDDNALTAAAIGRDLPQAQDWSDTESIDFWYNGTGSGKPVTFVLKDNAAPDPGPDGWTLAWADEFNAPAATPPNPDNWGYEIGDVTPDGKNGWGNEELQYYGDDLDNAAHDGQGNLVLTLDEADGTQECYYGPCRYESARLISLDRAEFAYGRIESRLKVPEGQGIWPAFWSLGTDITRNPWPAAGEIDFMEFVGRLPEEIFGTIHGPGYNGGGSFSGIYDFGVPVPADYHTFTVEWEPEMITWYVDGIQYHQASPADVAPNPWVFEKPFFLLLNVAIGGNFGGPVGEDFSPPQDLLVDYVRVYQAPDTAERFETTFIDDADGWQRVSIPVSDLTRSAEQPDGAPNDGLTLSSVNGYGFRLPYGATGDHRSDAITRTPVPPPTELVVISAADGGAGSLRDALAVIADGGTITFDPALAGETVALNGQLTVDRSVTIDASTAPGVILTTGGVSRIMEVTAGSTVTVTDVVIRDGVDGPQGGGVLNNGSMTLERVVVTNNTVDTAGPPNFAFGGGGIYNGEFASLTLIDSTVSDNQSLNHPGGGVYGFFNSTVVIDRSTLSGNFTGDVAGGLRSLGNATIVNSTVSANTSTTWHGGGVFHTDGQLTVTNSTFTDNNAPAGTASGIVVATFGAPANATLTNNVLEGNGGAFACAIEGGGAATITSGGSNVISDLSCNPNGTTDQSETDALLGSLADNGGPTMTHSPGAGSPAIDAALTGSCPAVDQRGIARPQGVACDVGSVEVTP